MKKNFSLQFLSIADSILLIFTICAEIPCF